MMEDGDLICSFCKNKFVNIGKTVFISEKALQKATQIAKETDERIGQIVEKSEVDNLTGKEGEVAGVVNGAKFGNIIVINDFIATGLVGEQSFDPILAIDERKEQFPVFASIRRHIIEKKVEVPVSLLADIELEEIRSHFGFERETFYKEIDRLMEEGDRVKIGDFHSHEIEGRCLSEKDKKVIALSNALEPAFGKNSVIHVLISGTLIVYECGRVKELGRIVLLGYDWDEVDEMF